MIAGIIWGLYTAILAQLNYWKKPKATETTQLAALSDEVRDLRFRIQVLEAKIASSRQG